MYNFSCRYCLSSSILYARIPETQHLIISLPHFNPQMRIRNGDAKLLELCFAGIVITAFSLQPEPFTFPWPSTPNKYRFYRALDDHSITHLLCFSPLPPHGHDIIITISFPPNPNPSMDTSYRTHAS